MQAIDVFAAGIAYLKNHLMKTFSMSIVFMEEGDIHWILTVPAIWDDSAKQFVRKSANKVGGFGMRLLTVTWRHYMRMLSYKNSTLGVHYYSILFLCGLCR